MRKYISEYVRFVENNKDKVDLDELLQKIIWFQHERLIHLIVTLFYTILFLVFMILILVHYIFIIPAAMLMVFVILYLIHYFFLENNVQYLYNLYDEITKSRKSTKSDKKH